MAADHVRFTVKVLPAPRKKGGERPENEELQTLAIGTKSNETFEDLKKKVQARYNVRYNKDNEREVQLGQLQDSYGAGVFDEDTIGSLYDGTSGEQHMLHVRLTAADTRRPTATETKSGAGSAKRATSDEHRTEEQASAKRRRVQADRPHQIEEATSQVVDADGFKIPKRREQGSAQGHGGEPDSSAAVLVEDSQPETDRVATGSALARLQQRRSLNTSSPAPRSSPLVAVASKDGGSAQANSKSGGSRNSRKAFPTPDSRERQRSDGHANTSGRPASSGQKVSGWFKRPTPVATRSAPLSALTQEDPIEDSEHLPDGLPSTARVPSSSQPEGADPGHEISRDQNLEISSTTDAKRRADLVKKVSGQLRTPSGQRCVSTQTDGSHAPSNGSASGSVKNTARSVAHGWTKEEDAALLAGMSSSKGAKVMDVLKKNNMTNRSASAARSRLRLLTQHQKDGQTSKLNFPSSSLARPQSGSDEQPAEAPKRPVLKRWSQKDIGTLRKAVSEGMDVHEIQAKHFGGRSQEAVTSKIREVRDSVFKLERERDSFPKDIVRSPLWNDHHSLRLRRAHREGLNVVAAASRYFKSMPTELIERNMNAYRQQMEDLAVESAISQQALSDGADADHLPAEPGRSEHARVDEDQQMPDEQDQDDADEAEAPQDQVDVDAEILQHLDESESADDDDHKGPVIQDSYETGSAAAITSSPPLLRKTNRQSSPAVVIPPAEQRLAQQAQRRSTVDEQTFQPQLLRRSISSGGQTQLNFQREKGKGAARPEVDLRELDRQYKSQPQRAAAAASQAALEREVIDVSSDEGEDEGNAPMEDAEESSQPLPQMDGSSSTVRNKRQQRTVEHTGFDGANSPGSVSVSSGTPSKQLNFELEQYTSAAEQSTQSQNAPDLRESASSQSLPPMSKPPAYVYIPSPRRGVAASEAQEAREESEDDNDAFQTQDPSTTLSQRQKKKAPPPTTSNAMNLHKQDSAAERSEDESPAFQTQDPGTTLSQKQKTKPQRKTEPARKATSMLQDAVDRFQASQEHEQTTIASDQVTSSMAAPKPIPKPRRNVYDPPGSSQLAAISHSQPSNQPLPQSSSEKRRPGQLPRILGPASKLKQRKKDAEAKGAARKAEKERAARSSSHSAPNISPNPSPTQLEEDVEEIVRDDLPTKAASTTSRRSPNGRATSKKAGETELHADTETPLQHTEMSRAAVNADYSHDATSQSQVQVQPTIELPYPQILSREPGSNGKLEVGRPGHSWMAPVDCHYLRTDDAILAAARQQIKGARDIKRLAQDFKLQDQQAIAMCCSDSDKLKELHKLERRYRRERRVEDGMPPSRGPAQRYWVPGMPKPIEWDVSVMPDSDDSMSSRGRGMDDFDEEMEEERSAEMDNDENPAYFDKGRHFSEVEDESEVEEPSRAQRLITDADEDDRRPDDKTSDIDEEPPNGIAGDEAELSKDDEAMDVSPAHDVDEGSMAQQQDVEVTIADPTDREHTNSAAKDVDNGATDVASLQRVEENDMEAELDASNNFNEASVVVDVSDGNASEAGDGDDFELPTAPPPISDSIGEASAAPPSDRELQDLVQSGEVDVEVEHEQDAPAFPATRLSPGLASPALPSQEGAFTDNSLPPSASFNSLNSRHSDENTAQYYRRRNASPNRNPELTSSMLPPWPSSGKVRSSLEASSTQTPPVDSSGEPSMASKKHHVQAEPASKKRKLDMTADEIAERASRKARKKERNEEKKAMKQAAKQSTIGVQQPPSAKTADDPTATKAGAPGTANAPARSDSKKKRKKRNKQQQAPDTAETVTSDQQPLPKPTQRDDRMTMPPPALPLQHVQAMQQSSLPSPDSERSATLSRKARKVKKRAEKRDARRSSMSASINDSMTSDASLPQPPASSPPTLITAKATALATKGPVLQAPNPSPPKQSSEIVETSSAEVPTLKPKMPSHKKSARSIEGSNDPSVQQVSKTLSGKNASKSSELSPAAPSEASSRKLAHKISKSAKKHSLPEERTPAAPATKKQKVAKSIEKPKPGPAEQTSGAPSRKGKGKDSKPGVGANTGLKRLVDFQAHIPEAPKARPQVDKAPVKPSLFEDDDDDEDSTSSDSAL